mmetsp:Transcript_12133/g.26521  ORF Transcript_12133/g.26521 Transcript_12133/m.26521 type:complete len:257 (-) Transcript_12133:966-1736(-)
MRFAFVSAAPAAAPAASRSHELACAKAVSVRCRRGFGCEARVSVSSRGSASSRSILRASSAGDDAKTAKEAIPLVKPAPVRPAGGANEGKESKREKTLELGVPDREEEEKPASLFENQLQRPRDPSEIRTESENRRHEPVGAVRRRRRRRRLQSDELDWDNMETVPLVKKPADPKSGEDYWIAAPENEKVVVEARRKKKRSARKPVDEKVKAKLMKETVQPYKSNWIGVVVIVVLGLVLLYNVLPNQAPMISIPDL